MTQELAHETVPRAYPHRQVLKILSGLVLGILTAVLSTSVVATALPTIAGELGGQEQLSWVPSAALLTMTVSTPLWGKLSDIFGRKRMFQLALMLYVSASMVAGLAVSMGMLIAARAVQGLGTGGLAALSQVILGDVVEPRERGRYSGYLGSVFGVSTVAGPLIGGVIVDTDWLGWRWCFYVCVPLALVAFVVIQKVLRLPRVTRNTSVDWSGAVTLTGGATALMLLLSLGGHEFRWSSPWAYGLGAVSLVLFALAVPAERRAADPILPPRLFHDRTFILTSTASLIVGVTMFGMMIYLPQFLQIVKGLGPAVSGIMTLPMVVSLLLASIISGRIVTRTGRWKVFPVAGLLLVVLGFWLLSRLHADSGYVAVGVDIAAIGLGLGMSTQMLILAAQNAAQRRDMAVSTSGVTFFRSLGGAVGVAAFGAILTNTVKDEIVRTLGPASASGLALGTPEAIYRLPSPIRDAVIQAFSSGMHAVFLAGVPGAILGLVAVLLLRELPLGSARPGGAAERDGAAGLGGAVGLGGATAANEPGGATVAEKTGVESGP